MPNNVTIDIAGDTYEAVIVSANKEGFKAKWDKSIEFFKWSDVSVIEVKQ